MGALLNALDGDTFNAVCGAVLAVGAGLAAYDAWRGAKQPPEPEFDQSPLIEERVDVERRDAGPRLP